MGKRIIKVGRVLHESQIVVPEVGSFFRDFFLLSTTFGFVRVQDTIYKNVSPSVVRLTSD